MITGTKRRHLGWWLSLLLLCGLAFGLRVYQLDHFGFWQDEGLTPLRAGYPVSEILSNRITIQEGISQDTHPPLYYLLVHFSRQLWGESDFAFRYFSVLWGVLLIPLVAQLGRRLFSCRLGLLAATLATVNPLQIWYAQEARMYTLLVFLAAAMTYLLWRTLWRTLNRPALSARQLWGAAGLYGLFAALVIYTHYTAVFLVAGQGLFWLWLLWRRGHHKLIGLGLLFLVIAAVPLVPFTIPRLFTGAETNYFYVPPWIMLQDVVHGFGLGMTVDFSQWSIKLIDLGVAFLLLLGLLFLSRGSGGRQRLLFLTVYLLAAVVGLALGSLIKPMYMGARHIIIGSPAFFFLAAAGLTAVWQRGGRLVGLVALFVLLVGPLVSLANLYFQPAYAKDDLRALVQTIEQRAGSDDLVLYNNAILLALHWHYSQRPDLPVTALPVYPYGADETTVAALAELAQQYRRIWYVPDPPADGRDAGGIVLSWLAERTLPLEQHLFHSRTMIVEAQLYQTGDPYPNQLPAGAAPVVTSWDSTRIAGWQPHFDTPAAGPRLWFALYWQGQEPPVGQQLLFTLRTPDGQLWASHYHELVPTSAGPLPWKDGGLMELTYSLPLSLGTPADRYQLWVELAGSTPPVLLGEVLIRHHREWPWAPPLPLNQKGPLHFANGVTLLGLSLTDLAVRPGHPLSLTLYWQRKADANPPDNLVYQLDLVGTDGQVWRRLQQRAGPGWLTAAEWSPDATLAEPLVLYFPPETPPGRYRLRWQLEADGAVVAGRPGWRPWDSRSLWLGSVTVLPWPLQRELPTGLTPVGVELGGIIELAGYRPAAAPAQPGDILTFDLVWRALAAPPADYFVFVHLVDENDDIVSQIDWIPVEGTRPTRGWRGGEVLVDPYRLPLPAELPPGAYRLWVGLYDPEMGQRLPVAGDPDGRHLLFTLTLP
jgi:hypothetical protein